MRTVMRTLRTLPSPALRKGGFGAYCFFLGLGFGVYGLRFRGVTLQPYYGGHMEGRMVLSSRGL